MLADAGAPAVLAGAPAAVMLADAGAPAVLAIAPAAVVILVPAVLAGALTYAVMLAGAGAPAVFAPVPLAICSQMLAPPQCLQAPLMQLCSQMPACPCT